METLVASTISIIVIGTAVMAIIFGTSSWIKGSSKGVADANAERAIRMMSDELRQAMLVTVDANGQGLTYQLPTINGSGNFTVPPVWDGVNRRFQLNGTSLQWVNGASTRTICKNIRSTDPRTSAAYRIFVPGVGSVTRALNLLVATSETSTKTKTFSGRYRETIYLRNIPELVR